MNVMRLKKEKQAFSLELHQVPTPVVGSDDILVCVHAAGVTPSELQWYPTQHNADGTARIGPVPGHEFSGTIAVVGSQVDAFSVGQPIFGMNDWFADGATAEFCCTRAAMIASKPRSLSHAAAATVPIAALSAIQGLDRLDLRPGERLLVHGASGSVGAFVVQMAVARGAEVIATASPESLAFVQALGAIQVLNYKEEPFHHITLPVNAIFDCVGGETLQRSWQLLSPGGRVVTIAADSEAQSEQRVKDAFFIVEPNGAQLAQLARQLEDATLKTFVKGAVSLTEANLAYFGKVPGALPYGKSVITIQGEESLP